MPALVIHPEVEEAVRAGRAVVALESAVITAGLPRDAVIEGVAGDLLIDGSGAPVNLALAQAMERIVRDGRGGGGIPATIAVIDGALHVGLSAQQLERLALDDRAAKASASNLAHVIATGATAGTTVSATLAAIQQANRLLQQSKIHNPKSKIPPRLSVLATGGIGGVHRGWRQTLDISADLRIIASTPVCVVCSGAKSILDLPATLETLEALGVPVVGYRTDCFPQFQCAGDESLQVSQRVDDVVSAAKLGRTHWSELGGSGVVLANPVPAEHAVPRQQLERAIEAAETEAAKRGIGGAARTPFLLAEVARLTEGRSLTANIALLLNNARLAVELARTLTSV